MKPSNETGPNTGSIQKRATDTDPELKQVVASSGSMWGAFSQAVARNMLARSGPAVDDAKRLTTFVEAGPRAWLIRLPIVNVALFETDDGLVMIDSGMAAAGPALLETVRKISDKPLHTVVYTHGHIDHAFGLWPFLEAGIRPRIIAHKNIIDRFNRYIRLRGSVAHLNFQPSETYPKDKGDIQWPDITFTDSLELLVGGERFVLRHHRGETDDHLYVWVPGRKTIMAADFYFGFLPNAGNGRRVQRYPEEWAEAAEEMASLGAEILLPCHGETMYGADDIRDALLELAEVLRYIVDHTIAGLNAQQRQDKIAESLQLPEHLANSPRLQPRYITAKEIARMVIAQYCGWWDEFASNWNPSPFEARAREIVHLSGGMASLVARTRELAESDIQLASHLAEWCFYADPSDPEARSVMIEVFSRRAKEPGPLMEVMAYTEAIERAMQAQ
jgi:glyoxylase-like metal-dependent hydrolase (beta-lactamase superfamily II)